LANQAKGTTAANAKGAPEITNATPINIGNPAPLVERRSWRYARHGCCS